MMYFLVAVPVQAVVCPYQPAAPFGRAIILLLHWRLAIWLPLLGIAAVIVARAFSLSLHFAVSIWIKTVLDYQGLRLIRLKRSDR